MMSEYNNTYTLCAQPKHYSTINNYVLINALKKVSLVLNSSHFIPSFLLRGKYYLEFLSIIVLFFFVVWAHLCIFMQYTALFFKTCFWTLQKWITLYLLTCEVTSLLLYCLVSHLCIYLQFIFTYGAHCTHMPLFIYTVYLDCWLLFPMVLFLLFLYFGLNTSPLVLFFYSDEN